MARPSARGRMLVWHRRLGLLAAALVIILAVTGVALNHTAVLGLDERLISNAAVVNWYGVEPDRPPIHFKSGQTWITSIDGGLYRDGKPLGNISGAAVGTVRIEEFFAVAAQDELVLFTPEGELVERLGRTGLPGSIISIGRDLDGSIIIRTPSGMRRSDTALLGWTATDREPAWSMPQTPPPDALDNLLSGYRGRGLPFSRVLLDIHTGRILGSWGSFAMDAAAIIMMVLVATGIHNWLRGR